MVIYLIELIFGKIPTKIDLEFQGVKEALVAAGRGWGWAGE